MSDQLRAPDAAPYDALLLLSFGGPEGPEDVVPFLENVTRGRGIPRERLKEVGQHYFRFGGVSPINGQNRELLDALRKEFAEHGPDLPVYWGNRNWAPYLTDVLREMAADGRRRIAVLATSAYASYSGCRQYRENLADALATLAEEGVAELPRVDKLRHYFNHPGFVQPMVEGVLASLAALPQDVRATRTWRSPPTPSRPRPPTPPAPSRSTATAARTSGSTWRSRGSSRTRCAPRRAPNCPGSWSTSRAAAPRTSPGWSPTSATTWRPCTRLAPRRW